jgi:hypothetical protein
MDVAVSLTNGTEADGEVVWFCYFPMKTMRYVV